ncbi:MAG TPA: cytochrome c oxidase assembly protein [Acidimicrobiales bacterium]|nr:cytochrome c oxidase assembly protein [Acidimicrobiales bacterium]
MGLQPLDFFGKARFEPAALAVLVAAGCWYGWSVLRLRGRGRLWPVGRMVSFALAWVLVALSIFSGLTAFAATNFSAFAVQYILVGLAAPALLALSAPITLAVQSSGALERGRWLERRPARLLGSPFTTWVLFSATLFTVFFTGVLGAADGGGITQQAVFLWMLVVGWMFFAPVADVDPLPFRIGPWPRILYLLLSFPVFAIMGMGLESETGRPLPGVSPASLHLGAAVIWVAGEGLALCGALWVFAQWLRADERRVKSQEQANEVAAARQLALWQASRQAAARAASR